MLKKLLVPRQVVPFKDHFSPKEVSKRCQKTRPLTRPLVAEDPVNQAQLRHLQVRLERLQLSQQPQSGLNGGPLARLAGGGRWRPLEGGARPQRLRGPRRRPGGGGAAPAERPRPAELQGAYVAAVAPQEHRCQALFAAGAAQHHPHAPPQDGRVQGGKPSRAHQPG